MCGGTFMYHCHKSLVVVDDAHWHIAIRGTINLPQVPLNITCKTIPVSLINLPLPSRFIQIYVSILSESPGFWFVVY